MASEIIKKSRVIHIKYYGLLKGLPAKDVTVQDPFWSKRLKVIRKTTIYNVLDKFEKGYPGTINIFENFRKVANGEQADNLCAPWFDGLVYQTIRGAADFLADQNDEKLVRKIDDIVELIVKAQDTDPQGYLNTYITLKCPENRWGGNGGNLLWQHELYNAGGLVEAGVHYYRATGKTALLTAGVKMANLMCSEMGNAPRKNIVPAHPLPEEAMVSLYRLFKEEPDLKGRLKTKVEENAYLELADFWIQMRGRHEGRVSYPRNMGEYAQDHRPLTEQDDAAGHAVRAALLYNGLINVAVETGKEDYFKAARRLWDSVVSKKLYITGGIGSVHNEEKFGPEYQLPDDGYLETCAAVAMTFWGSSMNFAFGDADYFDTVERSLYNNVLAGVSLDGTRYFYENPLVSDGSTHRWEWHSCPCCPPMLLKGLGNLKTMIYAHDDYGIYVNLLIGGSARFAGQMELEQRSDGPWSRNIDFVLKKVECAHTLINLRLPSWSGEWSVSVNGKRVTPKFVKGYLQLSDSWKDRDVIRLTMEMPILRMEPHPFVSHLKLKVALQKGPFVYCLESTDNSGKVDITLPARPELTAEKTTALGGATLIKGRDENGNPFTAVPYYAWDNREPGRMAVWLKQSRKSAAPDLDGWENALYRPYREEA